MVPFDWLEKAAAERPGHPAYLWRGTEITYAEFLRRAEARLLDFRHQGVSPGDHVVLLLSNTPAFPVAFCALSRIRAVMLPLSPSYHRHVMAALIEESGARYLVTTPEHAGLVQDILAPLPTRMLMVDESGESLWAAAPAKREARAPDPEPPVPGTAVLCPTSGSTGIPKLIMITSDQLRARVVHSAESTYCTRDDVILGALPFLNGFGRDQVFLSALMSQATVLLQDRFNPREVLRACASGTLTYLVGIGFMYRALMDAAPGRMTWPRTRLCMVGASFFPKMGDEFFSRFGHHLHNNYGSGEYSQACLNWDDDPESNWRFVGRPLPGCEIRILPARADAEGLAPGVGEVWVHSLRTPDGRLSSGYYRRPQDTAEHYRGEWAHAGDLGRFDEQGRLELIGRTRNMVKFAGVQVSGETIEKALLAHPDVAEAAVVWDRNRVWGEVVRVFVVARRPLEQAELFEHCRRVLPEHMVPRDVEFLPALPRTPSGKVDRLALVGARGPAPGAAAGQLGQE
ncbi:MAG: acyl--CoA ligase [Acetobacteraceae bacterium]|nr:acyl--CoA ligase [Acetobacteraceae bacterium]